MLISSLQTLARALCRPSKRRSFSFQQDLQSLEPRLFLSVDSLASVEVATDSAEENSDTVDVAISTSVAEDVTTADPSTPIDAAVSSPTEVGNEPYFVSAGGYVPFVSGTVASPDGSSVTGLLVEIQNVEGEGISYCYVNSDGSFSGYTAYEGEVILVLNNFANQDVDTLRVLLL
ncbi:hypothetical protein GC176_04015 [bacterium]|nr:hypothetical protein [bacterium]